jgi:hypothetical protein
VAPCDTSVLHHRLCLRESTYTFGSMSVPCFCMVLCSRCTRSRRPLSVTRRTCRGIVHSSTRQYTSVDVLGASSALRW